MRCFLPIFGFFSILSICLAGRLQIRLPDDQVFDNEKDEFDAEIVRKFSKTVLGLETGDNSIPMTTDGKLFEKPKALLVIDIEGSYNTTFDGQTFDLNKQFDSGQIGKDLKKYFGDEMLHVESSAAGIVGVAKRDSQESEPSFDGQKDIANMYELARIIKSKDRRTANVVDYYRIHLDVSNARTDLEKKQLADNIEAAINKMIDAVEASTGKRPVEVRQYHGPIMSPKVRHEYLKLFRKDLNVVNPRSIDFPARFAILVFIVFILIFATTSILWFMWDEEDMGKNSLVYRLSSGRQKKD